MPLRNVIFVTFTFSITAGGIQFSSNHAFGVKPPDVDCAVSETTLQVELMLVTEEVKKSQ
jgi:hypothetical protein